MCAIDSTLICLETSGFENNLLKVKVILGWIAVLP